MPPRVKFSEEDIVEAALNVVREKGFDAVTARAVAEKLGTSTRPIFTYFETMDQLREKVVELARECYRYFIERGLEEPVPFLGVGHQHIRFARTEPEIYRLLFLTKASGAAGGAMRALKFSQNLIREPLMRIYNMDGETADKYYRDLWLLAFSFATMIVANGCSYTDEEISAIFTEVSLAVCKAYKEIPGLPEGNFDRDAIFKELVKK
ncbi:MAG: TetR/AcrR family transcriptional regulator [Synergistaceae bacterium]|nr:TetR/AcrR family transcriptional regulator [Synergistaceae bacterium]